MNVSHDFWAHIFVFEQTFRYIFRPIFDPNACSVSTKGEQTLRAITTLVGRVEAVGKLGTWRIAAGVAGLLMGRQPPASKFNARMFYVTLNMIMAMLSALQVWSLMRLLRDWRRPFPRQRLKRIRRVIPLIYEFLVPFTGLIGLPKWTGASWNVLRLYAPDLAYWSLIMLPLTLAMGVLRAILIFFHRSREIL